MRSRYVKKCKCEEMQPVITKRTSTLKKGVLDIDLEVSCALCSRSYMEVPPKRTRMEDPQTSIELPESIEVDEAEIDTEEVAIEPDDGGDVNPEVESSKEPVEEEKQDVPEAEAKKEEAVIEPSDSERDSDENTSEDPIEVAPVKRRGRPPNTAKRSTGPVFEKSTKQALKDSGVPEGDLF